MKKVMVIGAAIIITLAMAGTVMAAGNTSVTVNANVQAVCSAYTIPAGAINLGALDPSTAPAVNGSLTWNNAVKCTKGQAITATFTGADSLVGPGGDTIPYAASFSTIPAGGQGQGFGAGKDVSLVITVDVAAGAYQDVNAGAYSDTFTVDFTP